MQVEKS